MTCSAGRLLGSPRDRVRSWEALYVALAAAWRSCRSPAALATVEVDCCREQAGGASVGDAQAEGGRGEF